MAKKKKEKSVEAIHHQDARTNIPTEELAAFVAEDEEGREHLLYPRDPSLDPQLVWQGKDEQDRADLAVPVVPVYIQEKVHPQALVENLRDTAREGEPEPEQMLFAEFDALDDFDKRIDFYRHDEKWSNRMILGDSLMVMTSLAEKEGLKGKVQTIYLDPPYGIKFGSNWQVSTRKRDVKDGKAGDATRQPEQVKAFRDTWELGIHSYLAYLRDRLVVARELLTETGSVFVQIGVENVHLVRALLDEVFGSENCVSLISVKKTATPSKLLDDGVFYVVWYSKRADQAAYHQLWRRRRQAAWMSGTAGGSWGIEHEGVRRPVRGNEKSNPDRLPKGARIYALSKLNSAGAAKTAQGFSWRGAEFNPGRNAHWKTTLDGLDRLERAGRLESRGGPPWFVRFHDDFAFTPRTNLWGDTAGKSAAKVYVVQTQPEVIERCLLMASHPGDLVLDPTCGSGMTALLAEQWGRRWITIDTSRVALALARTRLMTAKYPYYLLADTPEGTAKEAEITGRPLDASGAEPEYGGDVRRGFVYERVPHITLKAIANNEEIDEIWERHQQELEPLRAALNEAAKQSWEEWEIPREPDAGWPQEATEAHEAWWKLRRRRQEEIDASIARRADQELLVDRPYEDKGAVRVTGPFTVESLSPHRLLDPSAERPAGEGEERRAAAAERGGEGFESMILDNLRKAGVQNTRREERLEFDFVEPFAGAWVQAAGEYEDADGKRKRVAIAIGPEHGTVGKDQIEGAAKEAVAGVGFDLLLVLGFAFDAHASEKAKAISPEGATAERGFIAEASKQYGKLPVLLVRMNPDLSMGEELLKKTGAGNLFMVFGEPDIELREVEGGRMQVEIHGLDVYDPTTGEIRSSTTDEIACWFLDTDYNGESFFVRHAYFTGADKPYEKLKKALKAEIDEDAWSTLYRTESRPFDKPESGKIAVKVINHYGDEVLKVYPV